MKPYNLWLMPRVWKWALEMGPNIKWPLGSTCGSPKGAWGVGKNNESWRITTRHQYITQNPFLPTRDTRAQYLKIERTRGHHGANFAFFKFLADTRYGDSLMVQENFEEVFVLGNNRTNLRLKSRCLNRTCML